MPNSPLTSVWNKFPEIFLPDETALSKVDVMQLISELFVVGDYYYFLIDFLNKNLIHHNADICSIHGLDNAPVDLQQTIDLIHPDDVGFVLQAEEVCYGKVAEIGVEYTKFLKSSYCFRMRVADGSYHLFHHQAIVLDVDAQNRIVRSLNIHTDIQHLTSTNNYVATLSGLNGRTDFYQINLSPNGRVEQKPSILTNRELELLPLIAQGLSSIAIAKRLQISDQTVRVHRRNILRKTQTTTSGSMVRKCIEDGLL